MSAKRKKNVLDIGNKLKLIQEHENGNNVAVLAKSYNIGLQTVRDILRQKEKLLKFAVYSGALKGAKSRKTTKTSSFEELDNTVYEWFQQERLDGHTVSGAIILEKAKWFHKQMKLEKPFQASSGWLHRFKLRHGIRRRHFLNEKLKTKDYAADLHLTDCTRLLEPQVTLTSHFASTEEYKNVESEMEMASTQEDKVSAQNALVCANVLSRYLHQENDVDFHDVLNMKRIRNYICRKVPGSNTKIQTKITDYFKCAVRDCGSTKIVDLTIE